MGSIVMSTYHVRSWLAIATGLAASGGALFILLEDAVRSGVWTREHYLMPVMVGIVVATGHLVTTALRNRSFLTALGFAVAFTMGTGLTLYASAGKQAETTGLAIAKAETSRKARQAKEDDLARSKARLDVAEAMISKEMTGQKCLVRCQDWKVRADEVRARIAQLETDQKGLEPGKPVAASAGQVAKVIAMLGIGTEAGVKALLLTIEPFAFALLFEITAITAFGFAFGQTRAVMMAVPANGNQPSGDGAFGGANTDHTVVDWVREFRRVHGRRPRIPELQARFPGTPKTTAWRRCKAA